MTIRYVGWCLSGVRVCSSPELGKVLIAEGSLGVFLAWKPGRLGSDAYSTRRCWVLVETNTLNVVVCFVAVGCWKLEEFLFGSFSYNFVVILFAIHPSHPANIYMNW